MKNKYFVSFQFKNSQGSCGFGNSIVECDYRLEDMEDFRRMEDEIIEERIDKQELSGVIIMYWKKL